MTNENTFETTFIEEEATQTLHKGYQQAEKTLQNRDELERLLQRLEKKLATIPQVGDALSKVPALFSLLKSYANKEYTDLPIGTIVAIISALAYFVSPFDLIPDVIPGVGHLDDAAVVLACLKLVQSDVDEYLAWRTANGKNIF